MRLFSAILARNEASEDRFLKGVIQRLHEFSDGVLVLDDGSTDGTVGLARELGAVVRERPHQPAAWGNESSARRELWDFALEYATSWDDWLLICDADMEMVGDVRSLCLTWECNCWNFILFDLWNEREYRSDGYWQGHLTPRPWLFAPRRVPADFVPEWPTRQIHTGHFPVNLPLAPAIAPPDQFYWLHRAYQKPEARREKYEQYMAQAHQLSAFELNHARSIVEA